jgi:predicted HD phosphohydrolase
MEQPTDIVIAIEELFERRGAAMYFGEPVTQLAHALQCAWLAERAGASDALVVAALLHDVGHLVHGLDEDVADNGIDARHEQAGQRWLAQFFGLEVTEPVRLHVEAKRYICAAPTRRTPRRSHPRPVRAWLSRVDRWRETN